MNHARSMLQGNGLFLLFFFNLTPAPLSIHGWRGAFVDAQNEYIFSKQAEGKCLF